MLINSSYLTQYFLEHNNVEDRIVKQHNFSAYSAYINKCCSLFFAFENEFYSNTDRAVFCTSLDRLLIVIITETFRSIISS